MKLIGFTCAYNEEELIPYVMPYVERLGYDKFVVYNNMSTDRTVELLSQYPFVEIRDWDTNGQFDDKAKCELQCKSFRECVDMVNESIDNGKEEEVWMSWTDFDEVIYCKNYEGISYPLMYHGSVVFDMEMVNLISECLPPLDKLVHSYDTVKALPYGPIWCKPVLFLVNAFSYYCPTKGNHYAFVRMRGNYKLNKYNGPDIISFHLKFLLYNRIFRKTEDYILRNGVSFYKKMDIQDIYNNSLFPFAMSVCEACLNRKTYKHSGIQLKD